MSGKANIARAWSPQKGPQKALIDCPIYEIFYGGARGGGKTDGVLGKMGIKAGRYGKEFNCVFFREELPRLDDAIARSQAIYTPIGARWHEQKKTWFFPGGGRLRFRPLENVKDAEKYQGQNLSDVCIEEAGNHPDDKAIRRLHGAIRAAGGVPTQMHLTGNPGGAGQLWIKQRYIDPAPGGYKVIIEELPGGAIKKRVYIPSRVWDNKILLANDPDYIGNLHLVGSEALVKAWLDGDWGAIEGAYFDCWSDKMVLRPFELPRHWYRFTSFDWGSARPFSVGWWAVASETISHPESGQVIPKGAMIRYKEWYGAKKNPDGTTAPNTGLKLTAEEVGRGIAERSTSLEKQVIKFGFADPSIFKEDGGPSIAERMAPIYWSPADNKRVTRDGHNEGAMGGWDQMRGRMKGIDGTPMIYCFNTCVDSIRTIPVLQHDQNRPEDLDTTGEDHAADEWRYACMSRPWTAPTPGPKPPDYRPGRDYQATSTEDEESWLTA